MNKPKYTANGTMFEGKKGYDVMNTDGSGHIEWLTDEAIVLLRTIKNQKTKTNRCTDYSIKKIKEKHNAQ
jgi:hypothetical protein